MLFATVEAERLREAASWVVRLCGGRQYDPVLQGILIEGTDDDLRLSAWDYENSGTAVVPAVIRQPGRALVSGKLLTAVAKTLDSKKDVSLVLDQHELRMTSGRNVWQLPTMAAGDYPTLPAVGDVAAKLDASALRRAVHRILPCADRSKVAPFHGMVSIISAGQKLALAATDRYRFALAEIDWAPVRGDAEIDLKVPTTFLEACFAALPPSSLAAEFGASSGVVYLATPSQRLTGRTGAEEWPPWRSRLPSPDAEVNAIFVVSELSAALARVMAVVEDDEKAVRMTMSEGGIEIETASGVGSASAETAVSDYRGAGKVLAMKPRYLHACLAVLDSDLAVVRTSPASGAPMDFVPLDDDGLPVTDYRHILMPIDIRKLAARP